MVVRGKSYRLKSWFRFRSPSRRIQAFTMKLWRKGFGIRHLVCKLSRVCFAGVVETTPGYVGVASAYGSASICNRIRLDSARQNGLDREMS